MLERRRMVEHYQGHELVCVASLGERGWSYQISIVQTHLDETDVHNEASSEVFSSDVLALRAAGQHARKIVDAGSGNA